LGVAIFDDPELRLGDNGGEVGRSLSSMKTFCDENDGPNVDSNASADGSCDPVACVPQGERGSLGLFVNDDDGIDPIPLAAAAAAVGSHSLDLAVLMPRLCFEPNCEISDSLGDGLSALMRLQSFENTSEMLWRAPLSNAATSHSARESPYRDDASLIPPAPFVERPPNAMTDPTAVFSRPSDLAAFRRFSARLVSFSMFLPLSYHPGPNTSGAQSSIISTAATIGSMSP
jgi:hypothetical protein